MSTNAKEFIKASENTAFDNELHRKLNWNIKQYDKKVVEGKKQFADLESAKQRAKNTKWRAIENLDKTLVEFEVNFTKRGGKVLWAETAEDAGNYIVDICKKVNARSLVKSKSMVTEEIHLNAVAEANGIKSYETDLGEYIQQMDGEPPFHIVTPAMHKSKEDAARVFNEHHGTPIDSTPEFLAGFARTLLRDKYVNAEVGVTGANFILADIGGVMVLENEGNARMSMAYPKVHIVVVGIEKVIPSINDLHLFMPLLSTYGTGQLVSVYNTVVSGPRMEGEPDGPEEMYVILLDNGRTNVLAEARQRESLYCIRCGACLNACPVYKNVGGFSYNTTYAGPIGSVITPHMKGMEDFKHLSFASTLCGNCTEVCPMRINLHNLLVINRNDSVKEGLGGTAEKITWRFWRRAMLNRKMMNMTNGNLKNMAIKMLFGGAWGKRRTLPHFESKSFNEMWVEREGKDSV